MNSDIPLDSVFDLSMALTPRTEGVKTTGKGSDNANDNIVIQNLESVGCSVSMVKNVGNNDKVMIVRNLFASARSNTVAFQYREDGMSSSSICKLGILNIRTEVILKYGKVLGSLSVHAWLELGRHQ